MILTENEYNEWKEIFDRYTPEIRLDEWGNSGRVMSEKEIFAKAIYAAEGNEPIMCISYMLDCNKLSEDIIKNLMYVFSGLFSFDCWNDDVVNYVYELLIKGTDYNCYNDLLNVANGIIDLGKEFKILCQRMTDNSVDRVAHKIGITQRNIDSGKETLMHTDYLIKGLEKSAKEWEERYKKHECLKVEYVTMQRNIKSKLNDLKAKRWRTQYNLDNNEAKLEQLVNSKHCGIKEFYLKDRLDWRNIKERQLASNEFIDKANKLLKFYYMPESEG